MQDQPTIEAMRLVKQAYASRLTTFDHRILKDLARRASEEAQREYWPQIWNDFAERFDAQ